MGWSCGIIGRGKKKLKIIIVLSKCGFGTLSFSLSFSSVWPAMSKAMASTVLANHPTKRLWKNAGLMARHESVKKGKFSPPFPSKMALSAYPQSSPFPVTFHNITVLVYTPTLLCIRLGFAPCSAFMCVLSFLFTCLFVFFSR